MGWTCKRAVKCERCKLAGPFRERSDDAEEAAVAEGWQRGRSGGIALHLCPECFADGPPEWWPDSTGLGFIWRETKAAENRGAR